MGPGLRLYWDLHHAFITKPGTTVCNSSYIVYIPLYKPSYLTCSSACPARTRPSNSLLALQNRTWTASTTCILFRETRPPGHGTANADLGANNADAITLQQQLAMAFLRAFMVVTAFWFKTGPPLDALQTGAPYTFHNNLSNLPAGTNHIKPFCLSLYIQVSGLFPL